MHTAPERLHGLDAVRGFALLLGIALHASMAYLPGAQYFWIVADTDPSTALGVGFHTIHLFRMTLFFVLAGFFARLALQRRGTAGFVRDRAKRIVLPLLLFWPIVMTGIVAALVWGAMLANGGVMPAESPPGPAFTPDDFPLAHLWFLYLLVLFYVAALALRGLATLLDRRGASAAWIDRAARLLFGPAAPLLLGVPVAVALFAHPGWLPWFGIPTPDQSLYPNRAALVGYGVAFGAGWLLQRQHVLLDGLQRHWPWMLGLALGSTAAGLWLLGLQPNFSTATGSRTDLLSALLSGLAGWSWTLALLGLGLRFLSGASAARRYLADASYWMYLMHLPLVMALQVAFSRLAWPWYVEMTLLLGLVVAVLLGTYALLVRRTWLATMLGGTRRRRDADASRAAASAG